MILRVIRARSLKSNYANKSQTQVNWSQPSQSTTTTFPSTTVSTLSTTVVCTTGNPQDNRLVPALVVFACISVLLLIIIIILVFKWRSDKKRIPTSTRSQERSGSRSDYNHGYVDPNNIIQGRIAGGVAKSSPIRENKFCENCRRTISENGRPDIENKPHDYIYLQDNAYRNPLPDADMKTSSHKSIPEVIYRDSGEQDTGPSTSKKADPIYHIIDTEASRDPKAKPVERTDDPDSNPTNLYDVVELNIPEKS